MSLRRCRHVTGAASRATILAAEHEDVLPGQHVDHASEAVTLRLELILAGSQQDFPVVDSGRVAGVLTRADLLTALAERGQGVAVREVMQREFQMVDSGDMLESAMERLQECACHTLPVQHAGRVVGLLTMDNVGEFVAIQAALSGAR